MNSEELAILSTLNENCEVLTGSLISSMVQKIFIDEQWDVLLVNEVVQEFVSALNIHAEAKDFHSSVMDSMVALLKRDESSHSFLALFGISCLKLFIQGNWTGPDENYDEQSSLNNLINSKDLNLKAMTYFESEDNDLYPLVKYPILLFISKIVLLDGVDNFSLGSLTLWSIKYIAAFSKIVTDIKEQHASPFHTIFQKTQRFLEDHKDVTREIQAEFYMSCSHLFLTFYDYNKAQECLDTASKILGLQVSLTSALGKRTKFQIKELPQMKLNIKIDDNRETPLKSYGEVTKDLPTDVTLDNDTLLPHIKFIDGDSAKSIEMSSTDQAFVIANCVQLRKTKPRDDLSYEEILPYVDSVLQNPQSWVVQFKALFLRCITEFSNTRKAERALQQLEELAGTFDKKTPKGSSRQAFIQSVDFDTRWEHERRYAQLVYSLGLNSTALEIFLRLHIWDDVIACYQRLGKHGKAEGIIREQLAIRETATLWCLLGDATMDKQFYEKAWEFSKHRNARSQKSLARWYMQRQEFEKAIPHFEKSLELNCLQPGLAFTLGCACMAVDDLERAAKAFQQSVSLDPDTCEAWSNLASCFIRLGQLPKAYKALQQATSLSYNNWRVWENFLLVSTDIGAFNDAIHSCHRLVDLGRKKIDNEALRILVNVVTNDTTDKDDVPASRLKDKVRKMFSHITSSITTDPEIWESYAKLCLSNKEYKEDEKALQYLYKSHRSYTQQTDWEKSEKDIPNVMRVTIKLIEVTKLVCESKEGKSRALSLYSTTKMAIYNLLLRLKKAYQDNEHQILPSVQPTIQLLEEEVTSLQNILHDLQ